MALRRNGNKVCKFAVDCAMEGGHRVYPAAFRPVRVNAFAAPGGRVDGMSIALPLISKLQPIRWGCSDSIQLILIRDL